jgi:TrmH family RNA methyltransferase
MFPLSKLAELSPRTRLRKIARILQGIEVEAPARPAPDADYLAGILHALEGGASRGLETELGLLRTAIAPGQPSGAVVIRAVNALRHAILSTLHAEPAEWDLLDASTGSLDRSRASVLPMTIYLEDIRSPFNVGSIFRMAEAFGAARVLLSPSTPLPTHPRAARTSLGASQALPWEVADLSVLSGLPAVFALEMGGTPLSEFPFPGEGVCLLGSEELGLSPEALELADGRLGRVTIPLGGAKKSLNVSVAFGILMQAWHAALTGRSPEVGQAGISR